MNGLMAWEHLGVLYLKKGRGEYFFSNLIVFFVCDFFS